jgi:hypothetical protein
MERQTRDLKYFSMSIYRGKNVPCTVMEWERIFCSRPHSGDEADYELLRSSLHVERFHKKQYRPPINKGYPFCSMVSTPGSI